MKRAHRRNWHSLPEYQALRALMQAKTTVGAARLLGLSQSAISRSIANLESRLGVLLFENEAGRLRPTQRAIRLNRRLDPLFEALDRIDGPDEAGAETLRIAVPPSYSHRFIVSMVASFCRTNSGPVVNLEVATTDLVLKGVLDGRFDLALSDIEQSRAGVTLIPFLVSPAVCAMQPDHPFACRDLVAPADLHRQRLIALTYRRGRRAQLDRLLHQAGAEPRISAEVSTSLAAAHLVAEGLGVAVINPFPACIYLADDLAFVRFDAPMCHRGQFIAPEQRPLSRLARAFMRHVRLTMPTDPFSERA